MNKFALFITSILLFTASQISAQCVTNYAISSGLSGVNNTAVWTNIPGIRDAPNDDGVRILSFVPMNPGLSSSIIGAWNFNLAIPCNASIDNVSFTLTRRNNATTGDVRDENFQLKFGDFTFSPVNGADATTSWANLTTGWETVTYSPSGGWGTSLTPEIINDPLFGLIFSVENFSTSEVGMPEIDAVQIEVCYTVVGAPIAPIESVVVSSVDNLCDPVGNGSITINTTGGTGSYEYSIDGGATWSATNSYTGLPSDTYNIQVRDTDMSCFENIGAYYIGCNNGNILQVGDAIYSCLPTPSNPVTLAIDRIQPLNEFYNAGQFFDDVSDQLQSQAYTWTTSDFGGSVFGVTVDGSNNIYTGLSTLYNLITPIASADLIRIDGVTGTPAVIATLPGNAGAAQVEYQEGCEQLFAVNLDDGMIYRYSPTGTLLSTFDPLGADDGTIGLSPLGERLVALAFNYSENRLYYSVWSNDGIDNGTRNTIRSVAIDPVTCDFVAGTDNLEVTMPFVSETETSSNDYSNPVIDIEFDLTGSIMLLAESGFNSTIPVTAPHLARTLRYDGSTTTWTLVNVPPAGNNDYQYQIGTVNDGTNALGGIDFAYAGIGSSGCVNGEDTFIVSTADALKGVDCTFYGCVYGLQYMPLEGGRPETSVIVDLARAPDSQQKGFFGDVDVINGCCPCGCPNIGFDLNAIPATICAGGSSTLCVANPVSGTGPYTYAWSTAETTSCITVNPAATTMYSVTVTDANGCFGVQTVSVALAPSMTITNIVEVDDTDCTNNNGSLTITVSGGTAPLSYSIDGGTTTSASNVFTALEAGTYNIEVTDADDCQVTGSATLLGPSSIALTLSIASTNDSSCAVDDGTITITATGGTAPLSYSIDGGVTTSANNAFTGLAAGTYSIEVSDATSCLVTDSAILTGPGTFTLTVASTNDTSCAVDDGTITITTVGGVAPFTYSIDGGLTSSATNSIPGLAEGTYNIVVTDANGCQEVDSAILTGPDNLSVDVVAVDDTDCITANGSISITASGGTAPYNYSIDGGLTTSPNNVFSALAAGVYDVVVTDVNNCSVTDPGYSIAAPSCGGGLGDSVWEDLNGDGIQDLGEPGVPDVKVELYNDLGNLIDIQITNGNGEFFFDGTPPGDYYLKFITEDEYESTIPNSSGNSSSDSDVDDSNGDNTTPIFTLGTGEIDRSRDYGIYKCALIGELVWFDVNENSTWEDNENGINGLKVSLYRNIANLWIKVDEQYTDQKSGNASDDGYYKFCAAPGEYYLQFNNPPDRLVAAQPNIGLDRTRDSDITGAFGPGTTNSFTVASEEERCDIGAGFYPAGTIGDFVWLDNNYDGQRGDTESGIPGVEIYAINIEGEMVAHATSDKDGKYILDMLPQDQYYVQFDLPSGYMLTRPNEGDDETADSDVDNSNGPNTTPIYSVRPGDHVPSVDAGLLPEGLPVKWVSISGENRGEYNFIEWEIEAERNVSHYELQVSNENTEDFKSAGYVESIYGTYGGTQIFDYEHAAYQNGINYYRVKQIDLNDAFSYSKTISINNISERPESGFDLKVFPNPVLEELNIGLDLYEASSDIEVNLYDQLGRLVVDNIVLDVTLEKGYKLYTIDVTNVTAGVYSLEVIVDNNIAVKKVAITK